MNGISSILTRFAFRNLTRNYRRTLLSVLGVSIGCSIALLNLASSRGKVNILIKNMAEGGVGHLRIVPDPWKLSHDSKFRLKDWEKELSLVRSIQGVKVATPRSRVQGLLAMGTRMVGVEIVGVDPSTEPASFRYVRTMTSGRYLKPDDSHKIVIGQALADRLRVEVGDALVVTVSDQAGGMKSEMFEVLGIVNLGARQIEMNLCQINLKDVEGLSGLSGVGEIAVVLNRADELKSFLTRLKPLIPSGDSALSWGEINPQGQVGVALNQALAQIMTVILVGVALLGVVSSQLTAILERRKEFAVLLAIGMGSRRIVGLIFNEALALGTLSFLGTLLLSGPLIYYLSVVGIRVLTQSQTLSTAGMVLDPVLYLDFGSWYFTDAAVLTYVSTFLASIYPASFAVRLDPAEALRVSQ